MESHPAPAVRTRTVALAASGDYVLYGDWPFSAEPPPEGEEPAFPGYILADDVLKVYLNDALIYQSPDDIAQTTEPPIRFSAVRGDELRVVVEDVHGVCQRLSASSCCTSPAAKRCSSTRGCPSATAPSRPRNRWWCSTRPS